MRKNKGYSLVELLIALAIFSLVLVGIITMMRSTSASYKSGIQEARVQEEAQIAANQITDLLLDANKIISVSSNEYKFEDTDKKNFALRFVKNNTVDVDGESVTVPVNEVQLVDYADGVHVLAENVEDFKIEGLDAEGLGNDNRATIKLKIAIDGTSYDVSKEVAFRNHVEDKDFNSFAHVAQPATESVSSAENLNPRLAVNRYDVVNLSADYGIVSDLVLNDKCDNNYHLVKRDGTLVGGPVEPDNNTMVKNGTAGINYYTYYLELDNRYYDNYDLEILPSYGCAVTGKDYNGQSVTVELFTEKVKLGYDGATMSMPVNNTTNGSGGFIAYMEVKGIDINKAAKKLGDGKITYTVDIKTGASENIVAQFENGQIKYKNGAEGTFDGSPQVSQFKKNVSGIGNSTGQSLLGLVADPTSNGMFVSKDNPTYHGPNYDYFHNYMDALPDKTNKKAVFHIKIDTPQGVHSYDPEFKFSFAGEDAN